MFENEGTEIESTQSDVTQESSSGAQDSSQETQQNAAPQEQNVPFHEHPRWKEVMADRDAATQRAQALEQKMAEMERRYQEISRPKSDKPDFNEVRTKMAERLRGIDPEFQSYMSLLEEQALNANKALESIREERLVENLKGKFEDLASTNKLDAADKELYFAKLDLAYRSGQLRSPAELEAHFKAIHEPRAKQLDAIKRAAIEEYTKAKIVDATKPTGQPKGKAPAPGKVDLSKMSEQEARQFRNKQIVTRLKAGRET